MGELFSIDGGTPIQADPYGTGAALFDSGASSGGYVQPEYSGSRLQDALLYGFGRYIDNRLPPAAPAAVPATQFVQVGTGAKVASVQVSPMMLVVIGLGVYFLAR